MTRAIAIALDLGGTQIRVAQVGEDGVLMARRAVLTPADDGGVAVTDTVLRLLGEEVSSDVRHIAISAAGPVDPDTGVVLFAPTIRDFTNVPLRSLVHDAFGIPTTVLNDGNAAAIGEWAHGAGHGSASHFAFVTVSTGVGCGLLVNGTPIIGARGAAGEWGHCVVQPGGPVCTCGGRGHLEGLASGTAIAQAARAAIAAGERSAISELAGDRPITADAVCRAATAGDGVARRLVNAAATHLGQGLAILVALFDPDVIAIGGGVSRAGPVLWDPLRQTLGELLEHLAAIDVEIGPALLGDDAGLRGAAMVALDAMNGSHLDRAGVSRAGQTT